MAKAYKYYYQMPLKHMTDIQTIDVLYIIMSNLLLSKNKTIFENIKANISKIFVFIRFSLRTNT